MPTSPGTSSSPLNPQQTLEKFEGLITEVSDTPAPEPQEQPEPTPEPSETDTETPETPDAEAFEVVVDGEPEIVHGIEELKKGYSREKDYRKKTMALADEKRAVEAEQQAIQTERQEYSRGLTQIREALQQLQGEPDWDALHRELPPDQFLARKADWEHQKMNVERLKQAELEVQQKAEKAKQDDFQKYLRSEQDKLRAAIPEWSEPEVAKAEQAKMLSSAKLYGYTEQEVLSTVDHRAIRVLRDATKYRELHREPTPAVKAKVSAIKPAKPGTPDRPRPNAKQEKLIEQVAKSHKSMDAMRAIESLLPD